MLNNLTNFFNLIVGRRIKTQLEPSDLIAVGTKQSPALGDYKPTAIKFSDLQAQLGGGGTTSYKVYTALLTQSGVAAPVATVLENTIGNISFSYIGVDQYTINSSNLFVQDKTILFIQGSNDGDLSTAVILNNLFWVNSSTINCAVSGGGSLDKTSIEIRVYN